MSTVKAVLTKALKVAKVVGLGREAGGSIIIDALGYMNDMLSVWSNKPNAIHFITRETLTLTASDGDYSIGTGATLNTTRPIQIFDSTMTVSGSEYPVKIKERRDYDCIADKTTTGRPHMMYYEPTAPYGTLYFYFVPDSNYTLNLKSLKPFPTYALADDMGLPPGYEAAIVYNLAMVLGDIIGKPLTQVNAGIAASTLNALELQAFKNRIPTLYLDGFSDSSELSGSELFGR
jgi:hypothetical protein